MMNWQTNLTDYVVFKCRRPSRSHFIYINSPGGSVTAGLSTFDIMNYVSAPVQTIGIGFAASMASFILAGGEKGNRLALPHARIMIHQPQGGYEGQASDIETETREILRLRDLLGALYANLTGQPLQKIALDLDRDNYLSSHQARAYGLVDSVAQGDPNEEDLGGPDILGAPTKAPPPPPPKEQKPPKEKVAVPA